MRNLFMALVVCLSTTSLSFAQQAVQPAQCKTITAGGNLNSSPTAALAISDTGLKSYTAAQMPIYSVLDTVLLAASAGDSCREKLVGEYNSVTLEVHATIYSGTSCDSVTVNFWGTAASGNGQGSFKLLQTTTLGTGTAEQVITYLPASGVKNPYTNYRTTVDVADLAGTCSVKWQEWMLVR